MSNFLQKIIGDKKEWRGMQARARALPADYRIVYDEIMKHLWKFSAGSGLDTIAVLKDLLDLFEGRVQDGRRALEVTGDDVAAFCDGLLEQTRTYTADWRAQLNRSVAEKVAREERGEGSS